jgi:hypothetical protein
MLCMNIMKMSVSNIIEPGLPQGIHLILDGMGSFPAMLKKGCSATEVN